MRRDRGEEGRPLTAAMHGDLSAGDATVKANLTRPRDYEVKLNCTGAERKFVLPAERGGKTPIEHVFLIVRENKTYDAVLGDLEGANGMASLALFGGDITPNLHALAKLQTNFQPVRRTNSFSIASWPSRRVPSAAPSMRTSFAV